MDSSSPHSLAHFVGQENLLLATAASYLFMVTLLAHSPVVATLADFAFSLNSASVVIGEDEQTAGGQRRLELQKVSLSLWASVKSAAAQHDFPGAMGNRQ